MRNNLARCAVVVVAAVAVIVLSGVYVVSAATPQLLLVVNNYEAVSTSAMTVAGNVVYAEVFCADGRRTLGGGGTLAQPGSSTEPVLLNSVPINGETGWRVEWRLAAGNPTNGTVTVLCAKPSAS